jgi:hypothetical protein
MRLTGNHDDIGKVKSKDRGIVTLMKTKSTSAAVSRFTNNSSINMMENELRSYHVYRGNLPYLHSPMIRSEVVANLPNC